MSAVAFPRTAADVKPGRRAIVPSAEAEKIVALVSGNYRPSQVRKAYEVLRTMLGPR